MNGIPAFKNYLPVNTFDANNGNRFPHFKSISPSSNDSNGQLSNFTSFPNDTESQQEDTSSPCVWWNDCSPLCSFNCPIHSTSTMTNITHNTFDQLSLDGLHKFVEIFKQKRIQLGITQAEVGRALGEINVCSFGCLSQSTICRFESLSLSPTPTQNRRRRRTSISEADKYFLESFFHTVDCRPTTEQMIQLASQLNMTKNVIRVWFCNQRQKQKRLLKLPSTSL
ncbi:unnamed protein product [Trichobilharzia regenti]|nr:unnamed protein product [Trichobilharzia regenti]